VLHYLMQGPNTVTEQDEARADALAEAEHREEDRR
jgi:hypothetical protein